MDKDQPILYDLPCAAGGGREMMHLYCLMAFVLFCIELFASFVFSFAVGVHSIHMICFVVFNSNIAVSLFLNIDPCSSSM